MKYNFPCLEKYLWMYGDISEKMFADAGPISSPNDPRIYSPTNSWIISFDCHCCRTLMILPGRIDALEYIQHSIFDMVTKPYLELETK